MDCTYKCCSTIVYAKEIYDESNPSNVTVGGYNRVRKRTSACYIPKGNTSRYQKKYPSDQSQKKGIPKKNKLVQDM